MIPTITPQLNLTDNIANKYYISTMYDSDGKCYKTAVTEITSANTLFEQTTTSHRMAQGNHQRAVETYVNKASQTGAQIVYQYSYGCYAVRTTLSLKGCGITKSEQTEGLYYATPKALEKLKKQYKCAPNIDPSK